MAHHWTAEQIPDMAGKTIIITGANSGLGFEASLALARKGADVLMACRAASKGEEAAARIKQDVPDARLIVKSLDLASLQSVREFAAEFKESSQKLDVLLNNAGVMAPPYQTTTDGFELQIGTNHFGHFALTGLLLDVLLRTADARIVTVSSMAHKMGRMRFDDINWTRGYSRWPAYGQSKLANLLFTYELDRRLKAAGAGVLAAAAHPGYSNTHLQRHSGIFSVLNAIMAQPAHMGALPELYAATAPDVEGGAYYGPDGLLEMRGYPVNVRSTARSHDQAAARQLWELSEQATGVTYHLSVVAK